MKINKKATILIVEDDPINIRILGEVLEEDYQTVVATTGEMALEIIDSGNMPDLILLDIILPKINGYEVCKKLKENKKTQKIPIIFITTKKEEAFETRGLDIGAVDYIRKPFSIPIVRARVKTHVELKDYMSKIEEANLILNSIVKKQAKELEISENEYMELFSRIQNIFQKKQIK